MGDNIRQWDCVRDTRDDGARWEVATGHGTTVRSLVFSGQVSHCDPRSPGDTLPWVSSLPVVR